MYWHILCMLTLLKQATKLYSIFFNSSQSRTFKTISNHTKQCCGSGSTWIWIQFAFLNPDPDPWWECVSVYFSSQSSTFCDLKSLIRIRLDAHWFGFLDPDPYPQWDRKLDLDPDQHWNQCRSTTRIQNSCFFLQKYQNSCLNRCRRAFPRVRRCSRSWPREQQTTLLPDSPSSICSSGTTPSRREFSFWTWRSSTCTKEVCCYFLVKIFKGGKAVSEACVVDVDPGDPYLIDFLDPRPVNS